MNSTYATILTGSGAGAIGVVQVEGPRAFLAVRAEFRPNNGKALRRSDAGRPRFGRFRDGQGDEVIVLVRDPGGLAVEVHSHGGQAAIRSILQDLSGQDVIINPGRSDQEIIGYLATAPTLRVADLILDQSTDAFDRMRAKIEILASNDPTTAARELDALINRGRLSMKLQQGWKVVLAGRPNVGKSRLLNAIAGFERAIVSPVPGTTRDLVSAKIAIDGWPVELTDTAGVRQTAVEVEQSGIQLADRSRRKADLVAIILDQSLPISDDDRSLIAEFPDAILAANKADLPPAWSSETFGAHPISAKTGKGIDEFLRAIAWRIVPEPLTPGMIIPMLDHQVRWLTAFRDSLSNG